MTADEIEEKVWACIRTVQRSAEKLGTKVTAGVKVRAKKGADDGLYTVLVPFHVFPGVEGEVGYGKDYKAGIVLSVNGAAPPELLEDELLMLIAKWIDDEKLTRSMTAQARDWLDKHRPDGNRPR